MLPWQEGSMPESIRMWHQHYNKWVTRQGFMTAVRRGQTIDVAHTFNHDILPVREGATAALRQRLSRGGRWRRRSGAAPPALHSAP
jgi:hypothetical protein